jgi:hypothetical protein
MREEGGPAADRPLEPGSYGVNAAQSPGKSP